MFILFALIFLTSLFIGSFFNVLIDRIVRNEQFIKGRSYCESCKHPLETKDLIPLLSFIVQGGKCRYCKAKIPVMLPVGELSTALMFTSIFYWFFYLSNFAGQILNAESIIFLLGLVFFSSILYLTFMTDLKYQLIPDVYFYSLLIPYILGGALFYFAHFTFSGYGLSLYGNMPFHLLGALVMFLFFGFLHVAFKGKAMGEGDIYLASILALYLGLSLTFVMWFVAFLTGAFIGVILIVIGSKGMKSKIAFGPFIIFGSFIAMILGNSLVTWYIGML